MPLAITRRQAALTDLIDRLGHIQKTKGYNTDAGLHIFLGETPRWGEGDPPEALAISIGDDAPETRGPKIQTRTPISIWAIVPVASETPLVAVEAIIADIIEAVEGGTADPTTDRYLGVMSGGSPATLPKGLERGVTRALRREEGSEYVAAAVEYIAVFEESWGGPGEETS